MMPPAEFRGGGTRASTTPRNPQEASRAVMTGSYDGWFVLGGRLSALTTNHSPPIILLLYRCGSTVKTYESLENNHDAIEHQTDNTDHEHDNHHFCERVGSAIIELIPNKLADSL